jgi:hypothetical protein
LYAKIDPSSHALQSPKSSVKAAGPQRTQPVHVSAYESMGQPHGRQCRPHRPLGHGPRCSHVASTGQQPLCPARPCVFHPGGQGVQTVEAYIALNLPDGHVAQLLLL